MSGHIDLDAITVLRDNAVRNKATHWVDALDVLVAVVEAAMNIPECAQGENAGYCFTCHEATPCSGDALRAALAPFSAPVGSPTGDTPDEEQEHE